MFAGTALPVPVGPFVIVGEVVAFVSDPDGFESPVGTEVLSVSVADATAAVHPARPIEPSLIQAERGNMVSNHESNIRY